MGDIGALRFAAERIRRRHFQTGEMKSSSVGKEDERRKKILDDISRLDIRTYTLAVDKRELSREGGLAHKQSFFKFLNRRMYERLYRVYEDATLVADEHGSEKFMNSLKSYIDREIPPNLFTLRSFSFSDSRAEVLLQVADFISGSLARALDPGKLSPEAKPILDLIAKRSIGLETWPPRSLPDPELFADETPDGRHDELIRRHCLRQAENFLERNRNLRDGDDHTRAQVEVLLFLLFKLQYVNERKFVWTHEILKHLASHVGIQMSAHQVRSTVIAPLRDADVILASSPRGYKIPVSEKDMAQFVAHTASIVPPMLDRLRRARNELKMVSLGELDILASPGLAHLRSLVEADEIRHDSE